MFICYHKPANKYINNFINGFIIKPKIENLVIIPNKINPSNILGPYIWSFQANSELYFEIILPKIWDPSSGAIGIILNTASIILINTLLNSEKKLNQFAKIVRESFSETFARFKSEPHGMIYQ